MILDHLEQKKLDMENDPRWPPPSMEFSIMDFFLNPSLIQNHVFCFHKQTYLQKAI